MLSCIQIKNFTIAKNLCIDFHNGFNVLSGETGAGKSIWVDAVCYALGTRCDSSVISHGHDECSITLCFDLSNNNKAQQWLAEHDLNSDDECIIQKKIFKHKPSRNSINGQACTQASIRELAQWLISIHSQHQHQHILKTEKQLNLLDAICDNKNLLAKLNTNYTTWRKIKHQIDQLKASSNNHDKDLELLNFHLNEINELELKENDWQQLNAEHQRLHHLEEITQDINQCLDLLEHNTPHSTHSTLIQATRLLEKNSELDNNLKNTQAILQSALINTEEAIHDIQAYQQGLQSDPSSYQQTEEKINCIYNIARKHQIKPEEVYNFSTTLKNKIDTLTNAEDMLLSLEAQAKACINEYVSLSKQLSKKRKAQIKNIQLYMEDKMHHLGMQHSKFNIQLKPHNEPIHPLGAEKVSFLISTNPGQPLQPLASVASGGELSRIALALSVYNAKTHTTPTLLFDEVDTGISGKTANTVGQLLKDLGQQCQILCITHLHQVASLGDYHYVAQKHSNDHDTQTTIKLLSKQQRIDELARMLGGATISKQTKQHARELLQEAQ